MENKVYEVGEGEELAIVRKSQKKEEQKEFKGMVRAIAKGYDNVKVRVPGEVFPFEGVLGSWMQPTGKNAEGLSVEDTDATVAHNAGPARPAGHVDLEASFDDRTVGSTASPKDKAKAEKELAQRVESHNKAKDEASQKKGKDDKVI